MSNFTVMAVHKVHGLILTCKVRSYVELQDRGIPPTMDGGLTCVQTLDPMGTVYVLYQTGDANVSKLNSKDVRI